MSREQKLNEEFTQEELCKYCEEFIIEDCSISSMFMCEGRFCKEAREKYRGYLRED